MRTQQFADSTLVWDESRIEECAELTARTVIEFLEAFNGPDADTTWSLAYDAAKLVRARLTQWQES